MIAPKYYRMKVDIRSKIEDGTYPRNQALPSENELSELYGVSRITVRKALDELANENFLYKIQGKGTFVGENKQSKGINLFGSKSCVTELRKRGYKTQRLPLVSKIVDCDDEMAEKYGLKKGERYFEFERVYTGDEIPYSYELSFYLYRYVPGIEKRDLRHESIHTVLRDLGFNDYPISRSTEIKAIYPDAKLRERLKVDINTPLLQMYLLSYIQNEKNKLSTEEICLEVHRAVWRTDIIPLIVDG